MWHRWFRCFDWVPFLFYFWGNFPVKAISFQRPRNRQGVGDDDKLILPKLTMPLAYVDSFSDLHPILHLAIADGRVRTAIRAAHYHTPTATLPMDPARFVSLLRSKLPSVVNASRVGLRGICSCVLASMMGGSDDQYLFCHRLSVTIPFPYLHYRSSHL